MTTMRVQDIHNLVSESRLPCTNDAILCFFNVAADPSIMMDNPTATPRLKKALEELGNNMHSHGTLIIAMENLGALNISYLTGEFLLPLAGVPKPMTQQALISSAPYGRNQPVYHAALLCIVSSVIP